MGDGVVAETASDFSVRPQVLSAYADSVRGQAATIRTVVAALNTVTAPQWWFGLLPQSGQLADAYDSYREALLADLGDAPGILLSIAERLTQTAARYCSVDAAVAGNVEACGAGVGSA